MTRIKTMVLALASLALSPTLLFAQTSNPNSIGLSLMNLNAATLRGLPQAQTMGDIWKRLRQDFRMGEVNPELVRRHEQYYASRSPYFNRTIARSQPYLYHIVSEVQKRNMPAEIALLPFIESAFVTKARSHVGASGLWQFMPATGRRYGLEQTHLYDERHDVYAATDAALNYLQYLHGLFGDWSLALAAYNWGEGSVGRAIARAQAQGLDPVYENLRMPNETRNYVPKLLAVRNLINNPQAFGLDLTRIDNKPYFGTVTVDQPLDIQAAARLAGISEEEFLKLNPSFRTPVFIPKGNRKMLLPVASVSAFEQNYRRANKDELLSWEIYTPYSSTSLTELAQRSGMSVSEIRRLNNIGNNQNIAAGRPLLLAKGNLSSGVAAFSKPDNTDPLLAQALAASANNMDDIQSTILAGLSQSATATPPAGQSARAAAPAPEPRSFNTVRLEQAAPAVAQTTPATRSNRVMADTGITAGQTPAAAPANTVAATTERGDIGQLLTQINQSPTAETAPVPFTGQTAPALADDAVGNTSADVTLAGTEPTDRAEPDEASRARESVLASLAQSEAAENRQRARSQAAAPTDASRRQTSAARAEAAKPAKPVTYRVQRGDTLYSIAQRHNISVADLVSSNNLKGNSIRNGQVLKVVAAGNGRNNQGSDAKRGQTQNAANGKGRRNQQPTSYTVRKGDTLHAIASRFNVPVAQLQRLNKGSTLRPGQKIRLTDL